MRRRPLALVAAAALAAGLAAPAPASAEPRPAFPNGLYAVLPGFDPLKPSRTPVPLAARPRALHVAYTYKGAAHTLDDYLARAAQSLVVLDGGDIVKEWYAPGYTRDSLFQSWSMAKSFTSDAVGIALGEGRIRSLQDKATDYLPELKGSGYGDVTLYDLLRMSSGVQWTEEVDDVPMHVSYSMGWFSTLQWAGTARRGWQPGSRFEYTSLNSAVLALVVARATGVPYATYVQRKIWGPAGMASAAYIGNDGHGDSLGYCCYYATTRDAARFGKMMLDGGRAGGRRVVPASWVERVQTPSGVNPSYGLHWWIDPGQGYYASGLGDQKIYVSTRYRVVIVKNTLFNTEEGETLPAFRALAAEVARTR
ncbi:serine hydrolase domain-containing protein [Actinomadura parmotrematis]|uniref:Beta-lactamase family protein n=1 Tax=Actinomadura parmotrematis TaxID=2864039 RepID=A0ABS7G227_9ACTN|nr:serine hydrolase domain-containing protein [Actinomadura parmotrematis]MBW8486770.1 beta-lactamase family protein [Actinomadura parmotrematis]